MSEITGHGDIFALLFRRIGDSLLATPSLRALKQRFPDRKLFVLAEPQTARVFAGNPVIDDILITPKSPSPFQLAGLIKRHDKPAATIDFLSDPRTALACLLSGARTRVGFKTSLRSLLYTHRVPLQNTAAPVYSAKHKLGLARALNAETESLDIDFYLKESDSGAVTKWKQRAHIHESTRIIAIFPYSRRDYKRWQPDRYISLCKKLQAIPDFFPVLISGPGEADYCSSIVTAASLNENHLLVFDDLGKMAALLKLATVYVGNDGGPKHLAVAMGTPTITVFLNDPPEYWTPPDTTRHIALASSAPAGISVDTVMDELHRMFERCG